MALQNDQMNIANIEVAPKELIEKKKDPDFKGKAYAAIMAAAVLTTAVVGAEIQKEVPAPKTAVETDNLHDETATLFAQKLNTEVGAIQTDDPKPQLSPEKQNELDYVASMLDEHREAATIDPNKVPPLVEENNKIDNNQSFENNFVSVQKEDLLTNKRSIEMNEMLEKNLEQLGNTTIEEQEAQSNVRGGM